mgnify:CR=1 FL=1
MYTKVKFAALAFVALVRSELRFADHCGTRCQQASPPFQRMESFTRCRKLSAFK